jgi:hypothetical protein
MLCEGRSVEWNEEIAIHGVLLQVSGFSEQTPPFCFLAAVSFFVEFGWLALSSFPFVIEPDELTCLRLPVSLGCFRSAPRGNRIIKVLMIGVNRLGESMLYPRQKYRVLQLLIIWPFILHPFSFRFLTIT